MSAAADIAIADPRTFASATSVPADIARLHALAQESLDAATTLLADALDRDLQAALATRLARDGATLATIFDSAPSVPVARHLWRLLDAAWRAERERGSGVAVTVFAIPLVIVAGLEGAGEGALPGTIEAPEAYAALLREHGAIGGNRTFGLANALVAADAIDIARLPEILAWQQLPEPAAGDAQASAPLPPRVLAPAPIPLAAGREGVSLRFMLGTALAAPGVDLLADAKVGKWGMPFTQMLGRELGQGRVPVLALPRAPQGLLQAVLQGRAAQREVSAQLFVSNAARKLRASVGEPSAVISAHRAADAPGGGELRVSLSSPFEPRDAEGFRCPLYRLDRVSDVAAMLVELLRDCRVTDVRVLARVYPDRDAHTGLTLLFKADNIADELH